MGRRRRVVVGGAFDSARVTAGASMMTAALVATLLLSVHSSAAAGTLKVFVLAGQSNMEGHAEVATLNQTSGKPKNGTLLYQLTDPRTAKEFAPLWDKARNNWTVLDNVKAWTNEGGNAKQGGTQGVNGSVFPGVDGVDAHFG